MFSDALAMLVCGWRGVLVGWVYRPSIAVTWTTYRSGYGEAAISGRSREVSRNGANALIMCTASHSYGVTSPSRSTQLRSEEHTSELQSLRHLVCRLLLAKKKLDQHS